LGNLAKLKEMLEKSQSNMSIGTLRERKLLQKRVYFLQVLGIELGYHYNWYVYGPYSPALTCDIYDLNLKMTVAPETVGSYNSNSHENTIINRFRKMFREYLENSDDSAYWFELLASLHYMINAGYIKSKTKKSAVEGLLALKGSRFSKDDAEKAWHFLEDNQLIST